MEIGQAAVVEAEEAAGGPLLQFVGEEGQALALALAGDFAAAGEILEGRGGQVEVIGGFGEGEGAEGHGGVKG